MGAVIDSGLELGLGEAWGLDEVGAQLTIKLRTPKVIMRTISGDIGLDIGIPAIGY